MPKKKSINSHQLRLIIFVTLASFALASTMFIVFVLHPYKFDLSKETFMLNNMKIQSEAFDNETKIPSKYTCDGENISPPLTISQVPEKTESLVLIVEDPDAPDGNFTHYLAWNINPKTTEISEGKLPLDAVIGKNDFGDNFYGGPCPPSGIHRYNFKLFALNSVINLDKNSNQKTLEEVIEEHVIGEAKIVGLYSKSS